MQRRTFMQALTGLFAGLLVRVEPIRAAVKRKVADFSPLARWRHEVPTPVTMTSRSSSGYVLFTQEGMVVATMLRPAKQYTTLATREDYVAARAEALGLTIPGTWREVESWDDPQS